MVKTKILTTGLLAILATVGVSMNANKMNNVATQVKAEEVTLKETNEVSLLNNTNKVNDGEIEDATKYIINKLVTDGSKLVDGIVTGYEKTLVINLLKSFGIDIRDASIKYLERIENALSEIKEKLSIIEKKQDIYHAEEVLNENLYKMFSNVQFNIKDKVNGSLWDLAMLELDETIPEEEVEARRYAVYEAICKDYTLANNANGLGIETTLVTYATQLADTILHPNQADKSKDIFYYYDYTIGLNDKWTGQKIKNRRDYIAYCTNMLLATVNLAQFDMHYRYIEKPAARGTYDQQLKTMAEYVNAVGKKFQEELIVLDEQEKLMQEDHITTYLPTNTQYSTRMATLTYNPNDRVGDDSRQGLLRAALKYNGDYKDYGMAYHPEQNILKYVANDYKDYITTYGDEDYTINKYLKEAGFYAVDQELFDNAAGLFNGNLYADGMGYLNHDTEVTATYYNQNGDYTRTPIYKVDCYHTWYGGVDHYDLQYKNFDYYLCFLKADQIHLNGDYEWECYDRLTNIISRNLFYKDYGNPLVVDNSYVVHDCW